MATDNSKTGAYKPLSSLGLLAKAPATTSTPNILPANQNMINSASKVSSMPAQTILQGGVTPKTPFGTTSDKKTITSFGIPYDPTSKRTGAEILNPNMSTSVGGQNQSNFMLAGNGAGTNTSDSKTLALQNELVKGGYMTQAEMDTGPGIYGPKTTAAVAKRDAALKNGITASTVVPPVSNPSSVITPPIGGGALTQAQIDAGNANYNTQQTNTNTTNQNSTNPTDNTRQGLLSNLANIAGGVQPMVSDTAGQITSLRNELANKNQGLLTQGGDQQLQLGRAGVLQNTEAAKESALQQQLSNQIQGSSVAGGLYGSGVGYQQPMTQFGVLTNPATGQPTGGGTPQSAAFQGGQTQASVGMGNTYANNSAAITGANNQVQQLTGIDISNPSNLPLLNNILQNWQNEGISGPNKQNLDNTLNSINAAYSQVLGTQIDVSTQAKSSGQTIGAVLQNLNQLANQKQAGLKNVGTGSSNTTTNTSTSNTSSSGLYNF